VSGPTIGCIADDYTGGTDVAAAFRRQGLGSAADALEEIEETAKLYLLLKGHDVRPVTDHEAERLRGRYK
jgi:uncharacterized protein YgbK (DUF1537 family)